ncbi:MAG TPA: hypothetical protein VFT09_06545, partial [Ilumatobacteraceae bacterium]|nr:hypothetical protein [Ilumatobacteraceae bacterium]
MATLPHGSWPTPITSELVVRAARAPGDVAFDGADIWWSESRPDEGGRVAVLRREPGGAVAEVLAGPWNVRSLVHEYGGGAWWVRDGVLWFADWVTQRLHRVAPGGEPVALTPEPVVARGLRYADGDVSPDGSTILCVQECHEEGAEAVNTIVRLRAHEPSAPEPVVDGPDFVSSPRWRPDGAAWSWLEWDHPDMPWDSTRLVVSDGSRRTVVAGGDAAAPEAICQADWAPDGALWFSSDRSGFWSLYRWTAETGVEAMAELDLDVGFPHWVFGKSCFAFLDGGRVAFVVDEEGMQQLGILERDGGITMLDVPHTSFYALRSNGADLGFIGASPTAEAHVATIAVGEGRGAAPVAVVPPRDLGIGA